MTLSRLRILIAHSLYEPYFQGGAEGTVRMLANGLSNLGHQVKVLTVGPQQSGFKYDKDSDVEVIRVPSENLYFHWRPPSASFSRRLAWQLRDIWNRRNYVNFKSAIQGMGTLDIASVHNMLGMSSSIASALNAESVPFIQVAHDLSAVCPRSMYRCGKTCGDQCHACYLFRLPHRVLSQSAVGVVSVSEYGLKKLLGAGYCKSANVRQYVHNIRPMVSAVLDSSKKRGNPWVLGYIGALHPKKGLEELLASMNHLRRRAPNLDICLLIAGEGDPMYVKRLEEMASSSSYQVRFLGMQRPEDFYPNIDFLMVPSVWEEMFGNIVVEANAYGIPVLSSNRGGLNEIVHSGINGLKCDPNPQHLADMILQALGENSMLFDRCEIANRTRLSQEFSAWIRKWEEIYIEAHAAGLRIQSNS